MEENSESPQMVIMTPFDPIEYPRALFVKLSCLKYGIQAKVIAVPVEEGVLSALRVLSFLLSRRPSCIVCVNPSWRLSVPILFAARLIRAKCFFDCQDLFFYLYRGAKGLAFRLVETYALRHSDGNIFVSSISREAYRKITTKPSTVVPLGYLDLKSIYSRTGTQFGKVAGEFRVSYFGSGWQLDDLPTLMAAFRLFKDKYPGARLVLVGVAEHYKEISAMVDSFGLSANSTIIPRFDNFSYEMFTLLMLSDVLVIPAKPNKVLDITPRFKTYFYLMAGKPIVASETNAMTEVFKEKDAGILVKLSDPKPIYSALAWTIENPVLAAEVGENARQLYLRSYRVPECYDPYISFLAHPQS